MNDSGLMNMYHMMNNSFDRRASEIAAQDAASDRNAARETGAKAAIEANELSGDAAYYFAKGFEGWNIKTINPRRAGFLAEFKAGVTARIAAGL